jgi:HlyD family secretion protein
MTRRIVGLVVILALVGAGAYQVRRSQARRAAAAVAVRYATAQVKRGDIVVTINGTGSTQAYQMKPVIAGTTGTVDRIHVKEGAEVRAGQVLLAVANDQAALAVDQARVDLQVQEERLSDLLNPRRDVRTSVSGNVKGIRAPVGTEVSADQVAVELENETLGVSLRQAEIDLQLQEDKLRELQKTVGGQGMDVETLRLRVTQAELALLSRQADRDRLRARAVQPGRVTLTSVSLGDEVTAGQLLLTTVDDATILFKVGIPEVNLKYLASGQQASVFLNARSESVAGTLTAIAAEATPGKTTYELTIELSNPGWVRAGMSGTATITGSMTTGGVTYPVMLTASGSAAYKAKEEIRAKIGGRVSEVAVKTDEVVVAGQAVVIMTSDSLDLQLRQAENDVAVARANLATVTSSDQLRQQTLKVDQARLTRDSKKTDVDALLLRSPVAGVVESLSVRIGDKVATNSLIAQVRPAQSEPVTETSDLRAQRLRVEQARLTHKNRVDELAALQVKAPIAGIFTSLAVIEGDKVGPGTKLGTVVNYNRVLVNITVDELDVTKAVLGQKAGVTIDALPDRTFEAQIVEIGTEGAPKEGVSSFKITLELKEPKGLRGGMTAQVDIRVDERKSVLVVPIEAIVGKGGQQSVRVKLPGENGIEVRPVKVGLAGQSEVEIVKGLTEGELVVTGTSSSKSRSGLDMLNPNQMRNVSPGGR